MSYTDEILKMNKRMDDLEGVIKKGFEELGSRFDEMSKEVNSIKSGIHGNKEHDQVGYKQRISDLESDTRGLKEKDLEHDEFKKKVLFVVSWIGGAVTLIVNALILLLKSIWT